MDIFKFSIYLYSRHYIHCIFLPHFPSPIFIQGPMLIVFVKFSRPYIYSGLQSNMWKVHQTARRNSQHIIWLARFKILFGIAYYLMHVSKTKFALRKQRVPAFRGSWDLKRTMLCKNLHQWDCKGFPTNVRIPHLRIHKQKAAVVGSAVVKTA